MMIALLRAAVAQQLLRPLDLVFAEFIARLTAEPDDSVLLAAALLSRAGADGHSCLGLAARAGKRVFATGSGALAALRAPELPAWLSALRACPRVGGPGAAEPLVLEGDRLYLQRLWQYEARVAAGLRARAEAPTRHIDSDRLRPGGLFAAGGDSIDWQAVAGAVALTRQLTILAGGPGTGKTYTVLRLLAALLELDPQLDIRLAAPTGKAALRITESIRRDKAGVPCSDAVRARIPDEALTLHRLLGARPFQSRFRHDRDNPLHADVVVVDECSMVDLALMAKLLDALKPSTRLILIGDPRQLASVETGAVLGELCALSQGGYSARQSAHIQRLTGYAAPIDPECTGIADCVVELRRSRRFEAAGALGRLAAAVNAGDAGTAIDLLGSSEPEIAHWEPSGPAQVATALRRQAPVWFRGLLTAATPEAALEAMLEFQILCAHREGPTGVATVNALVEQSLRRCGLIRGKAWYAGRPVLITENDYRLDLYNGDVGVVHGDPAQPGGLRVWFRKSDGSLRSILPSQLGRHESVYAMTVHKSQGSEYSRVLIVLPTEASGQMLTRELIYTGLTRSKGGVEIWGRGTVLRAGIERSHARESGLRSRLALDK